ncbi:MAG TPA: hydrolase [Microbacteriaceae bacterium]|nr:hydrolase [Microbacteriaceae bacterium]
MQDYVVVPGFTDWHVHTSLIDGSALAGSAIARVLDLGANPETISSVKTGEGDPQLLYAGAFLTAPGGYPSDRSWATTGSWRFVETLSDAHTHVKEMADCGACVIKVALNSSAGPVLSDELLLKIVTSARAHKLPVVVHAEGIGQAARARRAGAQYLAHTPFSEKLSDLEIKKQANQMTWISTLDIHGWGEPDENFFVAIDNLSRFAAGGGLVLYGSDMGNGPTATGLNMREIAALQKAGLTEEQIIRALTGPAPGIAGELSTLQTAIPGVPGQLDFAKAKPHPGEK